MYFKLAFNNVKKSFKDYGIYFLTLTFSVCIFYVFNAIDSQKAMMDLSQTTNMMMQNLIDLIGYLSIFVAVVLGLLMLYANQFLIRRRKKELGLYMLMGMERMKISWILTLETFMVGLCSLVAGLGLGIFLSQGLSVFTAKLFGAYMSRFEFLFSSQALVKSIICFLVIYSVIICFNIRNLGKYKLIELLEAHKKNEAPKVKNLWVSVILFVLAVMSLGTSYVFIIRNGLMNFDRYFYSAFVLAFFGTLFFFMSLSGFLLKVMQCWRKMYYKEVNMFIFRQINSRINTTYISMTFICLMLAVTIVTFSSGITLNQAMTGELDRLTPFDASFEWSPDLGDTSIRNVKVDEQLIEMGLDVSEYAEEYASYIIYETPMKLGDFYKGYDMTKESPIIQQVGANPVGAIGVSEYNKMLALQGIEPITLEDNQYMLQSSFLEIGHIINHHLEEEGALNYNGYLLEPKATQVLEHVMYVNTNSVPELNIILPDKLLDTQEIAQSFISMNYTSEEMEAKLIEDIDRKQEELENKEAYEGITISAMTKTVAYDANVGMSAILTYMTVYISIVFMITSAAILALQQLTAAEDNKARYQLLGKLGVDRKVVKRALFIQIAICFMMPLFLAIIHGVVGIYVANNIIKIWGEIDVLAGIIFTALIFVVIYGAYFVGTYWNSKNVIK